MLKHYKTYCVETDDWDNHRSHKLYGEMDDEKINDAHNVNLMNVGYCLTCGSVGLGRFAVATASAKASVPVDTRITALVWPVGRQSTGSSH